MWLSHFLIKVREHVYGREIYWLGENLQDHPFLDMCRVLMCKNYTGFFQRLARVLGPCYFCLVSLTVPTACFQARIFWECYFFLQLDFKRHMVYGSNMCLFIQLFTQFIQQIYIECLLLAKYYSWHKQ